MEIMFYVVMACFFVGCPMASKSRYKEFERYPKFKQNYIKAFDRMLETRKAKGFGSKMDWQNGVDVFKWWMGEDHLQYSFFDEGDYGDF